jgi:hypothetical protein
MAGHAAQEPLGMRRPEAEVGEDFSMTAVWSMTLMIRMRQPHRGEATGSEL